MKTAPDRLLLRLEWQVLRRLDGRLQGGYRTTHRGSGLDFIGLRPYVDGDDARHIDWNVTARLDEAQVREFAEDRELTAWLVLDRSASMAVGGPGRGKRRRARRARPGAGPAPRPEREPGRRGALRHRRVGPARRPAGHRTRPGPADRPGARAGAPQPAARRRRTWRPCWRRSPRWPRRCLVIVDLRLHRHRRLGTSADPTGPPQRGRRVARGRCRRRRAARGRPDRGRGCRDRRATAGRLRRPVVPVPVPRRRRRARGRAPTGMRRAGVPLHRVDTDAAISSRSWSQSSP